MLLLICLRCHRAVTRDWVMSWWACRCRVWASDEQLAGRVQ